MEIATSDEHWQDQTIAFGGPGHTSRYWEIATSDEHWQDQTIALVVRHTQAGDIGASRAE